MKYFSDISWLWCKNGECAHRAVIRMHSVEGALLWKYCKLTSEGILELGRMHGGSTVLLLEATSHTDRKVSSVDMRPELITEECKKIFNQYEDRLNLITSKTEHAEIDHNYDLFFIDAGHDYCSVKIDIETHWNKLKLGGFAIYHDYCPPSFEHWCPDQGVKQFCDEWVVQGKMIKIESARSTIVFQKK